MENTDYPSLYQAADRASIKSQSTYIKLMGFNLGFMITAALLAILKTVFPDASVCVYVLSAILLFLGFIITMVIKLMKYDDIWYQGRALAESVKTLTWRYMTCSDGFENRLSVDESTKIFISKIVELTEQFSQYTQHLDGNIINTSNVTKKMNDTRVLSLNDRKEFYANNRIGDQKVWYANKADYNRKRQNLWFIVILVFQFLAICASVLLIAVPETTWNLVGLFTTLATVGIAWNQLKQHQEHKQAYLTAALELQLIEEKAIGITSEEEFSRYVLDSENAISREHTLWLVQKRK